MHQIRKEGLYQEEGKTSINATKENQFSLIYDISSANYLNSEEGNIGGRMLFGHKRKRGSYSSSPRLSFQ